ncbi:MAG: C25 family cysteine peptidase, partial [Bacteroidales bacterium]
HGVEFVLLGGDVELIPYRGFYCYVQSGGGYQDDGIPSDLYYSALDGNWNDNGNNLFGEPDEDDLLPEIAVARFPFSTPDELTNMVHKSHFYQNFPVTGELTNALMAGENLYNDPITWGSDYLELLIGERNDNGYTTIGIPEDYNFQKLYEENQAWSKYDLMAAINSGKQFVHHVGHASQTYVAYMTNSDITNANFSGTNGVDHNYTLLQTHGCDCGAFDASDCILEKMVTIDNFAVAVMGNSRFGWFNEGQTEGPAAHLHREMMDALYQEQMRFLGDAFKESKIQTAPWVEAPGQWEEGALRWNFYDLNILGDPAMSVWTNEPVAIAVTYENEIAIGSASTGITVTSAGIPMENFVCTILKEGVLCGSGVTDASGTSTIIFEQEITQPGLATLTVVGRNCLPASYEVQFIPGAGAYVVFGEYQINDEAGNNNQLADYGETVNLTVTVGNVGLGDAMEVMGTLWSDDPYVEIIDNTEDFGLVPAGQQSTVADAFTIVLSDSVPDQHMIAFTLNCQTDTDNWDSGFGILAQAPVLSLGLPIIFDFTGGNNNSSLDPGETDTIAIDASNIGHSNCYNSHLSLSTDNQYITLNPSTFSLNELASDETKTAYFEIVIDENTPVGTQVEFTCSLISGACHTQSTYFLAVGLVMEDFESGDFTKFEWQPGGDQPWTVSGTNPLAGNFSAKSGAIGDDQLSQLIIELEVAATDNLSFWRKVSSEPDYDFLRFYVDGGILGEWSGEDSWNEENYSLASGTHTLQWAYEKDINNVEGDDAAWLDNIVFPPSATILGIQQSSTKNNILVYPNPVRDQINILVYKDIILGIELFDIMGSKVKATNPESVSLNHAQIDVTNLDSGLYIIEVTLKDKKMVQKVIVQ